MAPTTGTTAPPSAFLAVTVVATALFLVIVAHRTRGGWRWRWGEED